eukprot:m.242197 g.242197  ORF g.242197 m.242197 type:complete len:518 (+) comp40215_c1_seq12:83-1636(+)
MRQRQETLTVTGSPDMSDREPTEDETGSHGTLQGDLWNILILLFLYILQGIPIGLAASVPMILQARKVSYTDQALFSMATWPFSMKLLWAPLVDAVYIKRMGRRKSWVIPTQYLIGVFMLTLSCYSDSLLADNESGSKPNVKLLTAIFFALYFLTATQDIAVDGWALTMLSKRNIGHQSTCNSSGQTIGYFLGYVVFLALESPHFCNTYIRSEPREYGVVTLSGFLCFWGIVFIVTTTLLWMFKREKPVPREEESISAIAVYKQSLAMLKRPILQNYFIVVLTSRIGFAAVDTLTGLKLVEAGVPKENLALLAIPIIPMQMIMPVIVARYTAGPRPMDSYLKAYPIRLGLGLILPAFVAWTHTFSGKEFPTYFYVVAVIVYMAYSIPATIQFVSAMAFNARIADPSIGATYMTFCNTVNNVASNWPNTLTLALVDRLTRKYCLGGKLDGQVCAAEKDCALGDGLCSVSVDGYYIEVMTCFCIGLVWLYWMGKKLKKLQNEDLSAWKLNRSADKYSIQ